MITRTQLNEMITLQTSMNAKVNPEWKTANYPFLRANVVEGGEAMEHHGWKWWKKQTMDKAQFAMELVDIWHFTLSHTILMSGSEDVAVSYILGNLSSMYAREGIMFDSKFYKFSTMDTISRVELLIGLSVSRRVSVTLFESLLADADMSWDDLYKQYVGKNVLNFFRQDNGYKEGTYIKIWGGREDNEHLVELLNGSDTTDPKFSQTLMWALSRRYLELAA